MSSENEAIEFIVLKWLEKATDRRFNIMLKYMPDGVASAMPNSHCPSAYQVNLAVWSLIRQGMLVFDLSSQTNLGNTTLIITELGMSVVQEGLYNPYNHEDYLIKLCHDIPDLSVTILQYAREALLSYRAGCYLATAVMAGVASEVAFIELCDSLSTWLGSKLGVTSKEEFQRRLKSKRQYNDKFTLFRNTVEMNKDAIGKSVLENIEIPLNSILEIFRTYRNDAGHAIGKPVRNEDADLILHLFPKYMQRLYHLKNDLT